MHGNCLDLKPTKDFLKEKILSLTLFKLAGNELQGKSDRKSQELYDFTIRFISYLIKE